MGKMKTEYGNGTSGDPARPSYEELLAGYFRQEAKINEQEARLKKQEDRLRELEDRKEHVNREYKSRLFSFIFGRKDT